MEVAKFLFIAVCGGIVVQMLTRRWTRLERQIATLSVGAHAVSAIAQELVYRILYGGGGDMFLYQRYGAILDRYMEIQPGGVLDVFALLFQTDPDPFPFYVIGAGSSTGSMSALAGLITAWISNELYVTGALIGMFAAVGTVLFYSALRDEIPPRVRRNAALAMFLLPSVVFWSSSLAKEAVVASGLGLAVFGIQRLLVRRQLASGAHNQSHGAAGQLTSNEEALDAEDRQAKSGRHDGFLGQGR